MIIFRLIYLVLLFFRYNCFFILGLIKGFPFILFSGKYVPNSKRQAIRFTKFLEKAGSLFIKLGQILATRVDIFSEVYIEQLKNLRSDVKIKNNEFIQKSLYKEFIGNFDDIFASIDREPIGVASIAVVYKAKLKNGEDVVIKYIKPNVVKEMKQDLRILKFIFKNIERFTKYGKISKPTKIIRFLEQALTMETDLRFEGASANELRDHFKNEKDMVIPKIYWQYATKNVLVEEWIEGIKIGDVTKLKENKINLEDIGKKVTKLFFLQTLEYGFFHGDIHSGNILVLKNGKIGFIDFGIMGHLDVSMRFYLRDLFLAFLNKDYHKAASIHFENGWISNKYSVEDFALACRAIVEKILDVPQEEIMLGGLLEQLFIISQMFEMEVQEDLLVLQKNLIYLESIGRTLMPKNNMWMVSNGIISEIAKRNFNFKNEIENKINIFYKDIKGVINKNKEIYVENKSSNKLWLVIIIILLLIILIK